MKKEKSITFAILFLFLGGCATQPNTENAARIIAYGEGERSPNTDLIDFTDSSAMASLLADKGVVYEIRAGDIISMSLNIEGDLAELVQEKIIDIRLKRNLWLFGNDSGWWASLDGEKFDRYDEVVGGELTVNLGTNKNSTSNDLNIWLVINTN